jgi:DUF2934 family protein
MPKTRTAPAPIAEPKTHRSATTRKTTRAVPAPPPIPEFDAAAHRKEIAQVAYRIWLERADGPGSPEEDWLRAEAEVRARHTR